MDLKQSSNISTFYSYQDSRRSSDCFKGRTDGNVAVNFPKAPGVTRGDFCRVRITGSTSQSLRGVLLARTDISGNKIVDLEQESALGE